MSDFVKKTSKILTPLPGDTRPVFRGMGDAEHGLKTGLDWVWERTQSTPKRKLELQLLRDFEQRAHSLLRDNPGSRWYTLMLGQHYGLPTRLLDWSFSPLVAAHFATLPKRSSKPETDRAIWVLHTGKLHKQLSTETFKHPTTPYTFRILTSEPKKGSRSRYQSTFSPKPGDEATAFVIEAPVIDPRVGAQQGAFSVSNQIEYSLEEFLRTASASNALQRILIPSGCVLQVRDELDVMGVVERDLFPDLSGISQELRRRAEKRRTAVPIEAHST